MASIAVNTPAKMDEGAFVWVPNPLPGMPNKVALSDILPTALLPRPEDKKSTKAGPDDKPGKSTAVVCIDVKSEKAEAFAAAVSVFQNGVLVPQPSFMVRNGKGGRVRGSGGKMAKPIRKRLWYAPANVVGAAGAAISSTVNMQPSLFTDWAAEILLYDEVKVLGGEQYWYVSQTVGAAAATRVFMASAYDPIDGTALANPQQALQYLQHCGPIAYPGSSVLATFIRPTQFSSRSGANHFKFKTLKQTARNATGVTVMSGGDWSSTADAADIYGFVKTYIPAPGGTCVNELCQIFSLDCLFRSDV